MGGPGGGDVGFDAEEDFDFFDDLCFEFRESALSPTE